MFESVTDIIKYPLSMNSRYLNVSKRIGEMEKIKSVLDCGNGYIRITSGSGKPCPFLKVTPEFEEAILDYLNNRIVELAKEIQILQGVTPIEYKESEEK